MYFNDCKTLDEAKNLFRDLCKKLHPDTSGRGNASQADFIRMFKEFKAFRPRAAKDQKEHNSNKDFNADEFYNLIRKFDGLEGIQVNFVGTWIWLEDIVQGSTKAQKEAIKAIKIDGYNKAFFNRKRLVWQFSPVLKEGEKRRFSKNKTTEQVKQTWGCKSFNVEGRAKLTA
jgi:hypothetical protein